MPTGLQTQAVQIGISSTPSQNFVLTIPAVPDGTMKLSRGVLGATTQDILTIDASNNVTLLSALAVASGGTGDTGTAWTVGAASFTPVSGSFTAASGLVWYKRIGKTVFINASLTVTTNGTGSGGVRMILPFVCPNGAVFTGREDVNSGLMLQGVVTPGTSNCTIFTYANNYPAANGAVLRVNGVYETSAA